LALTTSANELRFDRLLAPDGCGCGTADESTAGSSCSAERSGSACHACANNSWKHAAAAAASAQPGCPLLPRYDMSQQRTTRLRGDGSTPEAVRSRADRRQRIRGEVYARATAVPHSRLRLLQKGTGPEARRAEADSIEYGVCERRTSCCNTARSATCSSTTICCTRSTHRRKPEAHDRSRASHHAEAAHDISRRTSSVAQMMSWS
jgi:hypothetical protein